MVRARVDGFIVPCIPTRADKSPAGPDWVHEIKHDGYRLIVSRARPLVRLFTRRGFGLDRPLSRNSRGWGEAQGQVFHDGRGGCRLRP
jgi:hypothetical protein